MTRHPRLFQLLVCLLHHTCPAFERQLRAVMLQCSRGARRVSGLKLLAQASSSNFTSLPLLLRDDSHSHQRVTIYYAILLPVYLGS